MARTPVVARLKKFKPHDPEPQAPPIDGGSRIPPSDRTPAQSKRQGRSTDQAAAGTQPNNNDTSGKNKDVPGYYDQGESGSRNPREGTNLPGSPKNPVPVPKIPAPKKRKISTGLARYASQIK